jgi:hypothetical protein
MKSIGCILQLLAICLINAGFYNAAMANTSADFSLARMFFDKKNYSATLLLLANEKPTLDSLWLMAESYFRLKQWSDAKPLFEKIISTVKNKKEKQKAAVRIFDILLNQHDLDNSISYYVLLKKDYGNLNGRINYAMGKALYDAQYIDHAKKILSNIKKGDDFYARARYILASMELGHKDKKASIKDYNLIEKLKVVDTVDLAVKEMAILAQARLWADMGNLELARKAYERVSREPFVDVAVDELIRALLAKAEEAKYGLGEFAKMPARFRNQVENDILAKALDVVEAYRKKREITAKKTELETLMAQLMVETGRYDDARVLLAELSQYYTAMKEELTSRSSIWPMFSLDADKHSKNYLIIDELLEYNKDAKRIKEMRDQITESRKLLNELASKTQFILPQNSVLINAKSKQAYLEQSYNQMVINEQEELAKILLKQMAERIAKADFWRAYLVQREMDDNKKQIDAVVGFQEEANNNFEQQFQNIDKGSTP